VVLKNQTYLTHDKHKKPKKPDKNQTKLIALTVKMFIAYAKMFIVYATSTSSKFSAIMAFHLDVIIITINRQFLTRHNIEHHHPLQGRELSVYREIQ